MRFVITLSVSLYRLRWAYKLFQMSLTQKFKDAVSGAAVNVTALYTGTRYPVLHCERVETKDGVAVRVTLREETDVCSWCSATTLCRHHYGQGHGGYKRSQNSVLPYIQREERDHQPPYVTDRCIIGGAGIVPSAMLTISIVLLICIAFRFGNLMSTVECFNLAMRDLSYAIYKTNAVDGHTHVISRLFPHLQLFCRTHYINALLLCTHSLWYQ